jgi:biopolymer transport protein ExbD
MAKRKYKVRAEMKADEIDMTPMIDVTFQLIVFFLVANDLSKKEFAQLTLPSASAGVEDKATEDIRVILNIQKPADPLNPPKLPQIVVRGVPLDIKQLGRELQTKADLKRENGTGSPSAIYALIRADRETPWQHVQYVMQVCADPKIQIYKLQFATTLPPEEARARKTQ